MRITQQGRLVRLELYEQDTRGDWQMRFDFKVDIDVYSELRDHMLKALKEFKPK